MDTVVEPTFKNQLVVFNWYFLHVVISKAKWYIILADNKTAVSKENKQGEMIFEKKEKITLAFLK
ncbi:hypothetical protein [Paenibacillus polymyxa]|nr:hypothetical protein [Paenibacillus polymyxa]